MILWLQLRGVSGQLLAALLRLQLLTSLVVCVGVSTAIIAKRSIGGLTGSRTALLLSRIPVESTLIDLFHDLENLGLDLDGCRLCAASYIDNLFTVGLGVSSCTSALELILGHLADVWSLNVKPGSKTIICCRGCPDIQAVGSDWELQDVCVVLGWTFQSDAGTGHAWQNVKAKLWRAFFGNVKAKGFKKLSVVGKCSMLCRGLGPIFLHAAQVWPPQHVLAMKVDSLQRRFIGSAIGIFKLPCEPFKDFLSRRSRAASRLIESQEAWWTKKWFRRAVSWDDHCRRDLERQRIALDPDVNAALIATNFAWPPQLLDWKGEAFLSARRTFFFRDSAWTALSSATRTRVGRAKVQRRWHEGVAFAKSRLL